MPIQRYTDWRETCIGIHSITQMMGKIKLKLMPPQPEWGHVVLETTPSGFSTGLIPDRDGGLDINLALDTCQVQVYTTRGDRELFSLRNSTSISEIYTRFNHMLAEVGHETNYNALPQEMFTHAPFSQLKDRFVFDTQAASRYLDQCLFVGRALGDFAASFRGKRLMPSLFWGTFDLTTVLFSGTPLPPPPNAGIIKRVAFDEKLVEFGFWPGDETLSDPALFAMSYPFATRSPGELSLPGALFDEQRGEYIMLLDYIMNTDNPHNTIVAFCEEAFRAITHSEKWDHLEWLTKALLV